MTPGQQAAMAALDRAKSGNYVVLTSTEAAAIIDMLASPVVTDELRGIVAMPKEPSEDTIDAIYLSTFFNERSVRKVYRAIFASLRDQAFKTSRKRIEWLIHGRVAPGGVVAYHAVAQTEAERDDYVAAALKSGCHPVTIDQREVAG